MKVIGLIGGMSWESTAEYYRLINESVKAKLGGLHSARCVLYSVDFAEVEEMQRRAQWSEAAQLLAGAAKNVERAGAGLLLLCTNTMHKVADAIQSQIGIPLLHIADATAERISQAGIRRVGLLGTRFTMEEDFYRCRLVDRSGLDVFVPEPEERHAVHRIIYEELCLGTVRSQSKEIVARIISRLIDGGAEGIILGCTELGLLVHSEDCPKPLFDTTRLHALAAVELALNP
jgi:aspartate racemase